MTRLGTRGFRAAVVSSGVLALGACGSTRDLLEPSYPVYSPSGAPSQSGAPSPQASGGDVKQKVGKPYQIAGRWYYPAYDPGYDEVGVASWYGPTFNGKPTATGELFDMNQISAAHKTLPLPSLVEVTNLDNGRKMTVRVNDRGPFVDGRIIDLSKAAAEELGVYRAGLARVRVRYVGPAQGYSAPPSPARDVQMAHTDLAPLSRVQDPPPATVTPVVEQAQDNLPPHDDGAVLASLPQIREQNHALQTGELQRSNPTSLLSPSVRAGYSVQVGAFSNKANAQNIANMISSASPVEVSAFERNGATFYRVTVRQISDYEQVEAVRAKAADLGLGQAMVFPPE